MVVISLSGTQKLYLNFIQILDKFILLFGQLRSVIRIISSSHQKCLFLWIYLSLIINYILAKLFILHIRQTQKRVSKGRDWKDSVFLKNMTHSYDSFKQFIQIPTSWFYILWYLTFFLICFFSKLKGREKNQNKREESNRKLEKVHTHVRCKLKIEENKNKWID